MTHSATAMRISAALSAAAAKGLLDPAAPAAVFYDMTLFARACRELVAAFPRSALHAFALKACPVVPVIAAARACALGAECASIGEVALALAAGCAPECVIFDSPAKTDAHLRECIERGVHVNADNVGEVRRIAELRAELGARVGATAAVGLRVNPQMGSATIAETFTASATSKFGEPLHEARERVLDAFGEFPFLSCVHVHVGSQGCAMDVLVAGAAAAVDLADEVNERYPGRVKCIDIGGGLSVDYHSDSGGASFAEYADALHEGAPGLFKYRIITEFGRKLAAKAAWTAARVHHVKSAGGRRHILCHAGADLFVRTVYQPSKWSHRIELYDSTGAEKRGETETVDVAGPLCFSGDIIAVDVELPRARADDLVVVRDSGAYTLGMYSRHTSQLVPAVYGYEEAAPAVLTCLKKQESVEELVRFWGG